MVLFLHQDKVKFDRVYVFRLDDPGGADPTTPQPTIATLRFDNKPEKGLGDALPGGKVSVRSADGREQFIPASPA